MTAVYQPSADDRLDLISRNLTEVRDENIIKKCLEVTKEVNIYWGTAPTGPIHSGTLFLLMKLADFLEAQCHVTILIADLHANLDNGITPHTLQEKRSEYYEIFIKEVLKAFRLPIDKFTFIRGTKFQLREDYSKSVYEMIGFTSTEEVIKTIDDVVNPSENHLLSALVYPILQTLDEEFLDVDVQFGGEDQRSTFLFAEENRLPSVAKRAHIMQQMIPGVSPKKLRDKREESKIDLLLPKEELRKRIREINCWDLVWENNTFLAFLKYFIPMKTDRLHNYDSFEKIQNDLKNNKLKKEDRVEIVESTLLYLIEPIKKAFDEPDMKRLFSEAYPNHVPAGDIIGRDNTKNKPISKIDYEALKKEFANVADKMTKFKIKDHPTIMWSCRCSGEPHIGYLIPIRKLAIFSKGNWKVIILIEDIGAFLHSKYSMNKPSWNQLEERTKNYKEICETAFELFGGKKENLEIKCGSEFQLSERYMKQFYQCLNKVSLNNCKQILTEEMSRSLSSVIYTCMTAVDQLYLNTTVRLFGERNESIDKQLIEAIECPEQMPVYVYHQNLPALDGSTSMASPKVGEEDLTSISIYDSDERIIEKVSKVGSKEIMCIIEDIIWSKVGFKGFSINGNVNFKSVKEIKDKIQSHSLKISDLQAATSKYLIDLIDPIRRSISGNTQLTFARKDINFHPPKTDDPNYINPNTLNLHVALVESVERKGNDFSVMMSIGIRRLPLETECELNKKDLCLVSVQPGTSEKKESIVALLKIHGGKPLNLKKYPYLKRVTFGNHEVSVPHCGFIDHQRLGTLINAHLGIKDKRLVWKIDGSFANEIVLDN